MILGEAKYYFENIAKKQPKHIFPYRLSYPFIFKVLDETVGFELLDCPMSVEKALDLLCETRRIESHSRGRWAWCSFNEKSEFVFSSGWRDVNNDQYTKEWINKINPNQGKEGTRSLFDLAFAFTHETE